MHAVSRIVVALALAGAVPAAQAQALSLEEAIRSGERQSPRIAAQRHALTATEEQVSRATELPDPKVRVGIENLPVTGPNQFRYDREQMTARAVGIMQEFPNSSKRQARGERAARARDLERTMLDEQRTTLRRDIATAWVETHHAERTREALERLVAQLAAQADTTSAAVARGRQQAAESLMLRTAVEQAQDRVLDQERMVRRSRLNLTALVGEEGKRPLAAMPDLGKLAYTREALLARLQEHPTLRSFDSREALARAEVDLARTTREADWALDVGWGQRSPFFENMITVMVIFDLPWQRAQRQDKDIASRLGELERARAQREDARRVHEAEMLGYFADYDAASKRLERYRNTILPLTRDRADAAMAAYRGGRGELTPVLDAQRSVTETEVSILTVDLERARAWASINYLYPHPNGSPQ